MLLPGDCVCQLDESYQLSMLPYIRYTDLPAITLKLFMSNIRPAGNFLPVRCTCCYFPRMGCEPSSVYKIVLSEMMPCGMRNLCTVEMRAVSSRKLNPPIQRPAVQVLHPLCLEAVYKSRGSRGIMRDRWKIEASEVATEI